MKIDVITRHAVANYGSLLQTYATQQTINKIGFECDVINYVPIEEKGKNIAKTLCKNSTFWNKNLITRLIYRMIQTPNYKYSYDQFKKFRRDLLQETEKEYNSLKELKENIPQADIYCTGSDQVWGKMAINQEDREAYFLDFVPNGKKCISYASSIGKGKIDNKQKELLSKKLKRYSQVLVRENTAVEILKECEIENVTQVIDPTLLLNKTEWESLASNSQKQIKGKYILVYQLHDNKEFNEYAKKLAKELNLKLIRVSPSMQSITRTGKLVFMPRPEEFLNYIKNAQYIITDSFHGTVFAILFNKKFIDILPGETSTRITSILELFGIPDRILKKYDDFESIKKEIEYEKVNEILEVQRNTSIELLKKAINS